MVSRKINRKQSAVCTLSFHSNNAKVFCSVFFRLADMLDEHKEELATIESLDSGAVYTLALKTHIGMSIDTLRYFAGWADKIQVSLIGGSNVLILNTSNKMSALKL